VEGRRSGTNLNVLLNIALISGPVPCVPYDECRKCSFYGRKELIEIPVHSVCHKSHQQGEAKINTWIVISLSAVLHPELRSANQAHDAFIAKGDEEQKNQENQQNGQSDMQQGAINGGRRRKYRCVTGSVHNA